MHSGASGQWRGRAVSAVLFDLDGTLFDTLHDIAAALNLALAEQGCAALADAAVRDMIGRGAPVLIERAAAALGRSFDAPLRAQLLERFFHHYGGLEDSHRDTAQPFPGAAEALRDVHAAGLKTAVVTNKQHRFALALVQRCGLERWIDLVVGGDTCPRRKPDPQPLLFACDALQVPAGRALMIGDSVNDVQAARAAGMPVICVTYGYNEGRDPRSLDCDALLDSLEGLAALLGP